MYPFFLLSLWRFFITFSCVCVCACAFVTNLYCLACFNSYVERLLDRISNGVLAEDRRAAIAELQSVVAESDSAQLAFGAMGQCFFLICKKNYKMPMSNIFHAYHISLFLCLFCSQASQFLWVS